MSAAFNCPAGCQCEAPAGDANLLEEEDDMIGAIGSGDEVEIEVAFDTGAVGNVCGPDDVPANAKLVPNTSGKNFTGAGGDTILNHGTINTMCIGEHGKVGCEWKVADITRPLHGGTQVTGPISNPRQDVLMNAEGVYVVEPGLVKEMLKKVKPVVEYKRKGNLYLAKMKMTGFTRPGQA
jgi:hypothetical protein